MAPSPPCQAGRHWPTYRPFLSNRAHLPWTSGAPPPQEGQLGSAVTSPEGPDRSDAARDAVVAAFVLGWHVAELFHANAPGAQRRPAGVDRLTGIGELDPLSRARLLLAQVRVDLEVAWQFGRSNQDPRTPALSRRCWRPTCASRASSGRPWPSCTASC